MANYDSNSVSVIDGVTNTVTATISVGSGADPYGVAVDQATDSVYVTNSAASSVSVIDGATNTVTATITVGAALYGVAVDEATDTVYVAEPNSYNVAVIDGATNTVTATMTLGTYVYPYGVAVDESTNTVYVSGNAEGQPNEVWVIDGPTNTVTATMPVGSSHEDSDFLYYGVGVDGTNDTVYVASAGSNNVSVIDGQQAPGPPTIVSSSSGDGTVSLSWSPPTEISPSGITSYAVAAAPTTGAAATTLIVSGNVDSAVVGGLQNGTTYVVTVTADNTIGASSPSTSVSVTPGVPGAPTDAKATAGNASASVSFTAPASDGGAAISGYTVTAIDGTNPAHGGQSASGSASPITVSGLTNGDSYTFTVTATNADGTGAASAPSNAVTPEAQGAPTITGFSPTSGPVGTVVTIAGTNLENATVSFDGVQGILKKDSSTKVKVVVPSGAVSHKIVVTTPGGSASTATKFHVT